MVLQSPAAHYCTKIGRNLKHGLGLRQRASSESLLENSEVNTNSPTQNDNKLARSALLRAASGNVKEFMAQGSRQLRSQLARGGLTSARSPNMPSGPGARIKVEFAAGTTQEKNRVGCPSNGKDPMMNDLTINLSKTL